MILTLSISFLLASYADRMERKSRLTIRGALAGVLCLVGFGAVGLELFYRLLMGVL